MILVAAGVLVVIALANPASGAGDEAPATASPGPRPDGDPAATLALTSNMYADPARTSDLVAIIPSGREAHVTGRTEDGEWLRVVYPAGSSLEGWIRAGSIVADTAPNPGAVPSIAFEAPEDPGAAVDEQALPDLTVTSADVLPNGTLEIRISNIGGAPVAERVDVRVTGVSGELLAIVEADLSAQPLVPGRSASVTADVEITRTGLYVIEVDRDNRIDEENEFNNSLRVLLVGTGE